MSKETPEKPQEQGSNLAEQYLKYRGLKRHKEQEEKREQDYEKLAGLGTYRALNEKYTKGPGTDESPLPEKQLETQLEELMEAMGNTKEGLEKESSARLKNFLSSHHAYSRDLKKSESELTEFKSAVLKEPHLAESTQTWEKVDAWEVLNKNIRQKLEELPDQNPESFLAYWLLTLREYKRQLPSGIVETPSVKAWKEEITDKLLKNKIAALIGETGTGKTLIARKIAEELSGNYEFVAGHGMMTKEDLLYYLGISAESIEAWDGPRLVAEAEKHYIERNPDMPEKEQKAALDLVRATVTGQIEQKILKTEVMLAPVLRAAEKGTVVIVDEFNYIPPPLLASMNALSEAKPGAKITFAGKEIEVAPGFGIIYTGNITKSEFQRYLGREKLDPAFVNRLNSGLLEYNTPPQEIDISFQESRITREKKSQKEKIPNRDLFLIGLAHLVDTKGNVKARFDTPEQLWKTSKAFSLFQKLFAGENIRGLGTPSGTRFELKTYHASLRTFGSVIKQWKQDSFRYNLDWYLYDNLIRPASLIAPTEAAQFYYLLQDREGFFKDPAWKNISVDTTTWRMSGLETLKNIKKEDLRLSSGELKYFLPQDLAEAASGLEMPEVKTPELENREFTREQMQKYQEMVKKVEEIEQFVENWEETLQLFCEDEKNIYGETK